MSISRRDLLLGGAATGAVVGAGVLVPLGFVIIDDNEAASTGATGARLARFFRSRVASLRDLEVGDPTFFDYPFEAASNVLIKLGEPTSGGVGPDRDVVAFSNQCTHMGCVITSYQPESRVLGPYPCHYSTFDLSRDGVVSFGQATQNLARVLLELDGDDIYATGIFRLVYGHGDNLDGVNLMVVGESSDL